MNANGKFKITFNFRLIAMITAGIVAFCYFLPVWRMRFSATGMDTTKVNISGVGATILGLRVKVRTVLNILSATTYRITEARNFLAIILLLIPAAGLAVYFIKAINRRLQLWISTGISVLTIIAWFIAKAIIVAKLNRYIDIISENISEKFGYGINLERILHELGMEGFGKLVSIGPGMIIMILATLGLIALTVLDFIGIIDMEKDLLATMAARNASKPRPNPNAQRMQQGQPMQQNAYNQPMQQMQQNGYGQQVQQPMQHGGYSQPMQQAMPEQQMQQPIQQMPEQPVQQVQEQAPAQVQRMFCVNCGNKLDPGARFCNKCGNKVE